LSQTSPIFSQISPDPDLALEASLAKCATSTQDGWMTALPVLEPVARDLLVDVALAWLVGHVDLLVSCPAWQELQPKPFTEAAKSMILQVAEVQKEHDDKVEKENGNQDKNMEGDDGEEMTMEVLQHSGGCCPDSDSDSEAKDGGDEEKYEEANEEDKKNDLEEEEKNDECDTVFVIAVPSDTDSTTVEEDVEKDDDKVKEEKNKRKETEETELPIETELLSWRGSANLQTQETLVRAVVSQWVGAASVTSASEAIRLATPGDGKLFDMLMEDVTQRWSAAEHQNEVLEGGRHEGDKSAAVAAARKQADSVVRAECDETVGMLRSQLAEARSREEQDLERHEKYINDLRVRVNAAFPAETSIARRGCLFNMFF